MKCISNPLTINAAVQATFTRANTAWYWDYTGALKASTANTVRFNWDKETGAFDGVVIETGSTNLLLNSTTLPGLTALNLVTQTVASLGIGVWYVLSFYGTGSVQMSGGVSTQTLAGTGANKRVYLAVLTTGASVTFTVAGSVTFAQFETGLTPSSVIPTGGTAVSRPADVIIGTGIFYSGFVDATATYNAGTAYSYKNVVQYVGRLYESRVAGTGTNTGNTPGVALPTVWLDIGPTNDTAAFDMRASTRSVGNNDEEVICIYTPSNIDAVGVMNMAKCNYVQVLLRYSQFNRPTSLYKAGYPTNAFLTSATVGRYVTIVVNNAAGTPSYPQIGEIVMGTLADLGDSEYGFQWSLVDYSKVTDDGFGIITFTKGSNIKLLTGSTKVLPVNYNTVTDLVATLTSVPTVYQFTDVAAYESGALIFAFMKNARMSPPGGTHSILSVDLQGLT